jgi:NAD+ synthase (glutamine-hydrolysing)
MSQVTVGLAQITPHIGKVEANLELHMDYIREAHNHGVELLVFPELSLTGYNVQDLAAELAILPSPAEHVFETLCHASRNYHMDLMVGFIERDARHRQHIAAAYLSGGEIAHVHRKVYLCTYALFDEGRYFAPGDAIRAFDTRFGRVGMLICEDFWHVSPPYVLWMDGADCLLMHSASPGRGLDTGDKLSAARWVQLVNQAYGSAFTSYVIHCNRAGYEDGLNFWGGSTIVDPDGDILIEGPLHEDALVVRAIDLNQLRRTRSRLPLLRDERLDLTAAELARIAAEAGSRRRDQPQGADAASQQVYVEGRSAEG